MTALGVIAVLGLASSSYLATGYLRYERLVAADRAAISRTASANADLQDALARMRDEIGAANLALRTAQNRVTALSAEAKQQLASSKKAVVTKADRIVQLTHALGQAQRELHLAEAQRVTLLARLSKAEAELSQRSARQQQAQADLEQRQKKIKQLTAERDKATNERDRLRARVGALEKHSLSQNRQPAQSVAQAQPVPAPAAPPPPAVAAATRATPAASAPPPARVAAKQPAPKTSAVATVKRGGLAQFERVLASAGVDVTRLFAQYGMRTGVGGPVVAVPRGGVPTLSSEQLAALGRLARTLPISAPLNHYRIGSPFGIRHDPMNRHREFHTGIDLLARYMSPVYATAPGVVTFSGYRHDYGKIVEIDHGHGISTRYAHLHRALVSVGQRVSAHQQIGLLGSTGRATGPHVHYEVLVNGEPQDPAKFFALARLVQVSHHR